MKYFFSALVLCSVLSASGQLVLEHTYPGETKRVKLEKSGEKYYRFDAVNQQLVLYNADHSFWKEIKFPQDGFGKVVRVFEISETKLIPDKEIEITYVYDGGTDGLFLRIMSETEFVYFDETFVSTFELSHFPSQPSKLITSSGNSSSQVYAVPSMLLEKVFSGPNAKRFMLDNNEVKYFYGDSALNIHNADFSLFKRVSLPAWFKGGPYAIEHASQSKINNDGTIEVVIRNSTGKVILIDENGREIKRSVSGFLSVSSFPVHPDKLVLNDTVFSLPGLTVDHVYSKFYPFRVLSESGPKYLMGWGDSIRGYDAGHALFFNIKMPHPHNYLLAGLYNYSEKIFNTDNKLELLYRVVNLSTDSAGALGRICNQDQTILFNEVDANYFTVSMLGGGLQNKLLSYISDWSQPIYQTFVYSLPSYDFTSTDETVIDKPAVEICPNPASSYFNLCGLTDQPSLVTLYDINGADVRNEELKDGGNFDLSGIPKGIYLVTIDNRSGFKITKKLLVN